MSESFDARESRLITVAILRLERQSRLFVLIPIARVVVLPSEPFVDAMIVQGRLVKVSMVSWSWRKGLMDP